MIKPLSSLRHAPTRSLKPRFLNASSTWRPSPPSSLPLNHQSSYGTQPSSHPLQIFTLFQIKYLVCELLDYVILSLLTPLPLCPSLFHYTHGFLPFAAVSPLSLLLSSSSPDVGTGPSGSCCSLQCACVKHQLVLNQVCTRLPGRSCSSAVALDFYSCLWQRGKGRFHWLS